MHTLRTSLLLCMLIYINYAGSEALSLLNQMQPKYKEESELGSEDLIYKKATEQLKQQKPYLQVDEEETTNEVSFREFYKNVRSGKHEIVEEEEGINIVEPEHKEIQIQSYLQELSDGLEPQTENISETELQTDPIKLGKFKKYFVKEDEPKVETKIEQINENNQPIERKMTLREKLEMKKKQAQQPPVVAAIQIKQEINTQEQVINQSDQNVGKTTLMKKIEEFKKQKQEKESQQIQNPKEDKVQDANPNTVLNQPPENPLRKLLNKKAEEKKERESQQSIEKQSEEKIEQLINSTQEVELELKQLDLEQHFTEQNNNVQQNFDSTFELDNQEQENDESHQEYLVSDENRNKDILDQTNQQQQQQQYIESENNDQTIDTNLYTENQQDSLSNDTQSISSTSETQEIIVNVEDQNKVDNENENNEQINTTIEAQVIPDENLEQLTNNQAEEVYQINEQQNDDINNNQEIQQSNQEVNQEVNQESNQEEQQIDIQQIQDQQQDQIDNEIYQEEQQDYQNFEAKDEKQNIQQEQDIQQELNDNTIEEENKEIIVDNKNEDQVDNTLSQGFVMENNVETSDYLQEVQEAERLRKIKEVEQIIEEEERIKQDLEQKKIQDDQRLSELEEQEKELINEKEKEEQQIEQVQQQIDQEQSELQDFEIGVQEQPEEQNIQPKQVDNIQEEQPRENVIQQDIQEESKDNQIDEQQKDSEIEEKNNKVEEKIEPIEIKQNNDSVKLQDETLENGFNIDEYERQQHKNEEKNEQEIVNYSQSSELFHQNDFTTQVLNDQQEQIIEQNILVTDLNNQDNQSLPQIENDQQILINDNLDDLNNQINSDNLGNYDNQNDNSDQITNSQTNLESGDLNNQNQIIQSNTEIQNPLIEQLEEELNQDESKEAQMKEEEQNMNLDNEIQNTIEQKSNNQIEEPIEQSQDQSLEDYKLEINHQNDISDKDDGIQQSQVNEEDLQLDKATKQDDTPNLIPVNNEVNQNETYQFDEEIENQENEVVQFDVYNSSSDTDQISNQQQQMDQVNIKSQESTENQKKFETDQNVLSVNKIYSFSQLQQDMIVDDTIKIEHIDLERKQEQSISQNTLNHQKRKQHSFLQLEETEMDYNEEQFEIFMAQKRQQEQMEKEKKKKKLKAREEKQKKLDEEQFQQKLLQQKQQQEILKQQQQLIELQNQQLMNKQKYKMATKQNNQITQESKSTKGDNFIHLQKQQSQIQLLNQQIDTEFSFQQILSKVEKEERKGQKQLRNNQKHIKNADINFFQLTEKQQQNKVSLQSQDLFEAIKQEIKDCDLNNYTANLCQLCQSDVVYEINDDNWYLIGIAYGLKRHFQNLLNTVQYHFKNSKIYTSFNKEQQVCLTLGDQFEIENLEEILNYYNNQTLPKNSQFLRIPQKIRANFAQMKVDLNQHKFMNFTMNAEIKNQVHFNGFTVTEQQIKLSNHFNYTQIGSILYPGQSIPYKLNIQSNGIENMQLDLNPQIYQNVLENYLAKNYLQQIQVTYRDNLNSNFVVIDNEELLEIEITIQK